MSVVVRHVRHDTEALGECPCILGAWYLPSDLNYCVLSSKHEFQSPLCPIDLCYFCSFSEMEQIIDSDLNSEIGLPLHDNGHASDSSVFISSSESSYNSDQGSGNEDSRDSSYIIYEESSDELDYFPI